MKVWVTGAAGMLGRDVVATLHRWGVPHVATGREVDIADVGAVRALLSAHAPTHIVNCAAFTAVDAAEGELHAAHRANALGPENLGRAAAAAGLRVLHYSTDYVFDGARAGEYVEDDQPAPLNAYGRSKLEGERRLLDAHPGSFVVRSSWLFGAGGSNFVETMLNLMAERAEVSVVEDQHGRPTRAADLAEASLALVGIGPRAVDQAAFGLYHFANAGATTWHGFAAAIRQAALRRGLPMAATRIVPVSTNAFSRRAPRPRHAVLDTQRIEDALGRVPRSWTTALEDYFDRRASPVGGAEA